VEEKRVWPATTWWPTCFVVRDVGGGEASMCMAQRRESRRRVAVLVVQCVRCLGVECVREGYEKNCARAVCFSK